MIELMARYDIEQARSSTVMVALWAPVEDISAA
jgi:hypothetical protein